MDVQIAKALPQSAYKSRYFNFCPRTLWPAAFIALAIMMHYLIADHQRIKATPLPCFIIFLGALLAVFLILPIITLFSQKFQIYFLYRIKLFTVLFILLNIANMITAKTDLLPLIYFPSFDQILYIFVSQSSLLAKCIFYSLRLYVSGVFFGGIAGALTGILVGWSKKAHYWLFPPIRIIGPIPSSIWIPIALMIFPSLFGASAFIIGLTMWFPVTLLTSSGMQNVSKRYFEVASTLGANARYQVLHVAIPAALPSVFLGFFQGITMCFMALMIAEMVGVKYGIGWFVNWKQQTMSFDSVYAGLTLIALMCFLVINVLMKIRSKVLVWQEGEIRW